ncbi:hypothetical protein ACOACO_18470 [Nocardioides sp. CPCC 205120]|uniref:hypothetical protein n=1 Tax=Nocardioides sp. CPCC 205120 TaxID=3406462 RepID=UPI003B50B396
MSTTTAAAPATADESPIASELPTVLARAAQMQWEAPELRTTFVADGDSDPDWFTGCPSWCHGGTGHESPRPMYGQREHRSASLRVRQDEAGAYREEGDDGVTIGHLECHLVMPSRSTTPQIQVRARYGHPKDLGRRDFLLAPMHPDETRELIAVLQHLLKVGTES